mmetsp:Transcript_19054/g.26806  ORF Transcript_19054/g.26806 Transcript_19054/m.26806 type:complete len:257 (-) Transcript_19054:152-922(-)
MAKGRCCGRPVRTLTLWFCVCDILIAVLGIAIVPLLITDESAIYVDYGIIALLYYICSLGFSIVGFYGAYAIRKRYIVTLFIWLIASIIFFFISYIGAIASVESTCEEIHARDETDDRFNRCVELGEGLLAVAFIIVITLRFVYLYVGYKLMRAVQTLKKERSETESAFVSKHDMSRSSGPSSPAAGGHRSVSSLGHLGIASGKFGRSKNNLVGVADSSSAATSPMASSAEMRRGNHKFQSNPIASSADMKRAPLF